MIEIHNRFLKRSNLWSTSPMSRQPSRMYRGLRMAAVPDADRMHTSSLSTGGGGIQGHLYILLQWLFSWKVSECPLYMFLCTSCTQPASVSTELYLNSEQHLTVCPLKPSAFKVDSCFFNIRKLTGHADIKMQQNGCDPRWAVATTGVYVP